MKGKEGGKYIDKLSEENVAISEKLENTNALTQLVIKIFTQFHSFMDIVQGK